MKGSSLIVSIVLFVAVAILYVLHFSGSGKNNKAGEITPGKTNSATGLRIAYVKADSVILNYDLSQDLHDELSKKQEAYTNEFTAKRKKFEKEAAAFQEKLQRGGFLTEQRAVTERDRLAGKEQEIMKLNDELSKKLAQAQQENNQQILDKLMDYLKKYNETAQYDYILNGGSVLIGQEADNITQKVLTDLNEAYKATKSKTEE